MHWKALSGGRGDKVRITTQLIEAPTDTHIWAQSYDRTANDIFAIQDEIALTVVDQLKIRLLADLPKSRTTDPRAYALYLQASQFARDLTEEALDSKMSLYEQALDIDPDYANAWAGLATGYLNKASIGIMPAEEGFNHARELAEKTLSLDPDNAKAERILGYVAMYHDHDLKIAAKHFSRALDLSPGDVVTIASASMMSSRLSRNEQATRLAERALELDPTSPARHANLSMMYEKSGRFDEALEFIDRLLVLSPDYFGAHSMRAFLLAESGDLEGALEEMEKETFETWRDIGFATLYPMAGRIEESDRILEDLIQNHAENWSYFIASIYASRRESDLAFEWLETAISNRDSSLSGAADDRLLQNLHADPRWLPFLQSIGKAPEQLAEIDFNVSLP